ncbi:MAG TPA: hypothetical protein VLF20_00205 [Patescibacteria group bacterium]|nr:hypothetical protein [Patescibacteria group bacterium]
MIDEKFILISTLLFLLGGLEYLINTIKGKTKPNKVTWFLWTLAPLTAFFGQISQGVGLASLVAFSTGFMPLLIFIASFLNKQSEWKITRFDMICGALSITGLLLWMMTQVGNIAIIFGILADGLAALPTIVKSYKYPETESANIYGLSALNGFVTLLALKTWTFAYYGFPFYMFLSSLILYLLVQFKLGKQLKRIF